MTAAQLPDPEDLVLFLLNGLAPTVSVNQPADLATRLPYLCARRVGGAARHQRMLDGATFDVQAYACTRRAARDLCAAAGLALFTAWDSQTVTPYGHVSAHREISGASELPSGVEGVWRFQATHALQIRP